MSLTIRRDAVTSRTNDLRQLRRSHRAQAGALRAITRLVAKNNTLSELSNFHFDAEKSPPSDSEDAEFLKSIDLDSGRHFDEASIPLPTIISSDGLTIDTKLNKPSPESTGLATTSNHDAAPNNKADAPSALDTPTAVQPLTGAIAQKRSRAGSEEVGDLAVPTKLVQQTARPHDGSVASPANAAPLRTAGASLDDATQQLLDLDTSERPAKVVRLTTDDEQRAIEQDKERRRSDGSDPTKTSRNQLNTNGEAASSPSSTIGAYSAATPMPPQDSPDTSPDSETGEQIDVLPPKDLRPSPEEQRQKEEHDRLLEAQKEIARRQALGDVSSTPDDQLLWEEREAAARAAEEKAARESVGGPEPIARHANDATEAEEVVEEVMRDRESQEPESSQPTVQNGKATLLPPKDAQPESSSALEDGDNITVASRNRSALTIDTSTTQPIPSTEVVTQQTSDEKTIRMTARTSSASLQNRPDLDDFARPTSQQAGSSRDIVATPRTISPTASRHPPDTPSLRQTSASYDTPSRPSKQSDFPRTPHDNNPILEDLMALKGAAEDPDRDYLEPLFRIQAHDTPAGRTTSLTDLVRSASKTLSTEDQAMTIQERLDSRILRRIYHLQNANKWSLRQMDRCKEPEQPVTHHDHMMAEMKFMRRDFKAERKMKTSICAWLARRCADWVAASAAERKAMQVQVKSPQAKETPPEESEDQVPDLEQSGESAGEDEADPPTPTAISAIPRTIIVPPELSETVADLQKEGKLTRALSTLPVVGLPNAIKLPDRRALTPVSKFVDGKVLPVSHKPKRKRSRFDYEESEEELPGSKRLREDPLPPEDTESALFNPENKHIRDRLHANNAFRPPSEFVMPSTAFYEYRSGSQWICEDDMRLRRLAKEYSFNWSLIADELQTPTNVKSSAERRTPWECFERWVELEQLPAEMKKTIYFKTWYQRLETSQQAAERRYQAQVAAMQAQNNGQAPVPPVRRRTVPSRVDKRRNTRYLWLVDAMRKGARKKEQSAFKQAETQRAAAARKPQPDANQTRQPMLTPQEFSRKRHERDMHEIQLRRLAMEQQAKTKLENQKQMAQMARQQQQAGIQQGQQGMPNGAPNQQRPGSSSNPSAQQGQRPDGHPAQQAIMNAPMQRPGQTQGPVPQRNGHLAVPQMNGQAIPQAQMRPNGTMPNAQDMQRMAHANAQRNAQYTGQQQYPMQSPGGSAMTQQQQMASNQAMMANLQQQMNGAGQHQGGQMSNQQMSASPSMPPPPTPHQQQGHPQQLSSGHVPALISVKAQLRAKFPTYTEEQINTMATEVLMNQSQPQSTNQQARQSAMNAAAGLNSGVAPSTHNPNMQAYAHNQAVYQNAVNKVPNGNYAAMNTDISSQQQPQQQNSASSSPQQTYANLMRQRTQAQFQQMRHLQQGSPQGGPATLNGSPGMTPASPSMQYANPGMANQMPSMNMQGMPVGQGQQQQQQQQRPASRGATPQQMQRLGSSGSVGAMPQQGGSPGQNQMPQGSPTAAAAVQAGGSR